MSLRRRPVPTGWVRPVGRFASGRCRACGEWYTLDRQAQPWSRAVTCSERCAKVVANRERKPGTCQHCDVWQAFRDERLRQEIAYENGRNPDGSDGGWRDEDVRLISSVEWMRHAQGWGEDV